MNNKSISSKDSPKNQKQTPKGESGLISVIRLDGFRRLWIGQIFSQLADKFYIVLMVFLITQYWVINSGAQDNEVLASIAEAIGRDFETRAQAITLLATGIYVANTIPAMFLGTIAGIGADRWPKRRLMVASNGLRAFLVAFAPLCCPSWLGHFWGYGALLLMTFLESILTQFFAPAEQASIPLLVPKNKLLAANSLYQATSMGATIVGFALGAPILILLKQSLFKIGISGGEFILLPLCYGVSAISLSTLYLKENKQIKEKMSALKEIKEGLKFVKSKRTVRGAMLHLVLLYSLLAALYVFAISLASKIEVLGPEAFGTLLAISGIGMALGAIVIAQIGHRYSRRRLTVSGLGAIACSLVFLGQALGNLPFTFSFCGILGVGAALVAIPAQTTIQEDTPESQRGRIFGLQNNLINIALSLPLVLAGTLITAFDVGPSLRILAAVAILSALLERPWKRC